MTKTSCSKTKTVQLVSSLESTSLVEVSSVLEACNKLAASFWPRLDCFALYVDFTSGFDFTESALFSCAVFWLSLLAASLHCLEMTLSMPHQFVYCSVVAVFDTFDLFCVHMCVCDTLVTLVCFVRLSFSFRHIIYDDLWSGYVVWQDWISVLVLTALDVLFFYTCRDFYCADWLNSWLIYWLLLRAVAVAGHLCIKHLLKDK